MGKVNSNLLLDIGNASSSAHLGRYYQDFSPAICHIEGGIFAHLDDFGIPFIILNQTRYYYPILVIQYGLMAHEFIQMNLEVDKYTSVLKKCIEWLEENWQIFRDAIVWENPEELQFRIPKGWVSGMAQGQAISLYLRVYQLYNDPKYLVTAEKIYNSFNYSYEEGGFMRRDEKDCIWFEEFPTSKPSFVLNGFIYAILGIYDLYRINRSDELKNMWDQCVNTLETNLYKYDVWYWSIYDQNKKQLVSYYYQKNVHIPLMKIMYQLTNKEIFNFYAKKWKRNLDNPFHRMLTKIMYRVHPRLQKHRNK